MNFQDLKRLVVGAPLSNAHAEHEKLPKWKALPVFSSDALSSVAYATEEILIILAALSAAAMNWSFPIAIIICGLLAILMLSYRQTIALYPGGGGAYTVAKDNLGQNPGLLAAAALLLDYILTVAVSISAGVAAITSAFPELEGHRIIIGSVAILVLTMINLRGARESGLIFSLPTYAFVVSIVVLLLTGAYRFATGQLPAAHNEIIPHEYPSISIFLLLKAFSSGCAALTGVEAISNGVQAFKAPAHINARKTLTMMVLILGSFFLGITLLGHIYGVAPGTETVLSQIARQTFGNSAAYYFVQITTSAILFLAANTAYNDFPRLASILATDRYVPRQLLSIGDRLVFSNGIIFLGFAAWMLLAFFGGETHALIPLYSVGVFLSFSLSQTGMVAHHLKFKEPHWVKGLVINLLGAITTFIVLIVVGMTKFTGGAWAVMIFVPCMVLMFKSIRHHYEIVGTQLALPPDWTLPQATPSLVVIPISGFHKGVLNALQYARGLSHDIRMCVVDLEPRVTANIKAIWAQHTQGDVSLPSLVILDSPYRSVIEPILRYLDELEKQYPDRTLTVVIPEFVTKKWWHHLLHNQTAIFLKAILRFIKGRVVVTVRYHLET